MIKKILVTSVLLLCPLAVHAQSCQVQTTSYNGSYNYNYNNNNVETVLIAQLVALPVNNYSIGYNPALLPTVTASPLPASPPALGVLGTPGTPVATAQPSVDNERLHAVETRLNNLDDKFNQILQKLDKLSNQQPPAAVAPAAPAPVKSTNEADADEKAEILLNKVTTTFAQSCASCHEKQVAKEKGDGFVILDKNELFDGLDGKDFEKIITAIKSKDMPKKGPKLTAEQITDVVNFRKLLK